MNMNALLVHRWGKVTTIVFLFTASLSAGAAGEFTPTPSELLVLPPYCQARMDGKHHPDLVAQWKDMPVFGSVQHYCIGLNFLNRAYKSVGHEKISNSAGARDSFNYCIGNWPDNHPLMPEIYLNRGTAMHFLANDGEAVQNYYKALTLNPRLRGAYVGLADYFTYSNLRAEGLKIVTEGLRYLPGDKTLQRRYSQLGGVLPYPDPVDQVALEAERAKAGRAAGENASPVVYATENKETETGAQAQDSSKIDSTPRMDRSSSVPDEPKIGMSKNPWCRFCPPE